MPAEAIARPVHVHVAVRNHHLAVKRLICTYMQRAVAVQINKIQLLTFSPERCKKELPRFPSRCTMELISVVSKSADAAQKENELSENERIGRKNLIAIDLNSSDRDIEKVET